MNVAVREAEKDDPDWAAQQDGITQFAKAPAKRGGRVDKARPSSKSRSFEEKGALGPRPGKKRPTPPAEGRKPRRTPPRDRPP